MAKRKPVTKEQIATVLEAVADRVANEDYSSDIQLTASTAELGLAQLRNAKALKLLNRVLLLLSTKNATEPSRYQYVEKTVQSLEPLDPVADSAALRDVARELRASNN